MYSPILPCCRRNFRKVLLSINPCTQTLQIEPPTISSLEIWFEKQIAWIENRTIDMSLGEVVRVLNQDSSMASWTQAKAAVLRCRCGCSDGRAGCGFVNPYIQLYQSPSAPTLISNFSNSNHRPHKLQPSRRILCHITFRLLLTSRVLAV